MSYILKRLGFYLLAGWAALTLNFFLPRLMPGDPATALFARFKGRLSPEAVQGAARGLRPHRRAAHPASTSPTSTTCCAATSASRSPTSRRR